ncbi:MAG: alpha/beta hydrolase [Bacteroidaceae bacterium]|nr:alpha/beta hydrolase [Bacteroidaceae bacterium]
MKQNDMMLVVLTIWLGLSSCMMYKEGELSTKKPVADIDRKENIWTVVAGNSERSKLADMRINPNKKGLLTTMFSFIGAIRGDKHKDVEAKIDQFTYLHEIKSGYERDTYTDQPYIIPYLVNNSKGAVIIVPGGGYAYKESNGGTKEGRDIAVRLNQMGISAFLLNYRSNPYHYPAPMLDLQRAIRHIKHHAHRFQIDAHKISVVGFSAGGNLTATFVNLIQGTRAFPANYQPDQIDALDDSVVSVAMIYPALTYQYNVNMLYSLFDAQLVRNPSERQKLLDLTDLPQHIRPTDLPQFIAYSKKDGMVDFRGTERYVDAAREKQIKLTIKQLNKGNHGFSPDKYWDDYQQFLYQSFQ